MTPVEFLVWLDMGAFFRDLLTWSLRIEAAALAAICAAGLAFALAWTWKSE